MDNSSIYDFGAAIKFYRIQKHISQHELSEKSGVNRNTLASYEARGSKQIPSAVALKSIAEVFGITCDDMLEAARFMAATVEKNQKREGESYES